MTIASGLSGFPRILHTVETIEVRSFTKESSDAGGAGDHFGGGEEHADEIGAAESAPSGLRPADGRIRTRFRPCRWRHADRRRRRASGGTGPAGAVASRRRAVRVAG